MLLDSCSFGTKITFSLLNDYPYSGSMMDVLSKQKLNNLGRLWLAYTELQGNFYMLQLMTDGSGHFTSIM